MKIGKALFFAKTKEGEHFFRRDVRRRRQSVSQLHFLKKSIPLCVPCVCYTHVCLKKKKRVEENNVCWTLSHQWAENKAVMDSAHQWVRVLRRQSSRNEVQFRGLTAIMEPQLNYQAFGVRAISEKLTHIYSIPRPSASEAHTKSSRTIIQFPGLRHQRRKRNSK